MKRPAPPPCSTVESPRDTSSSSLTDSSLGSAARDLGIGVQNLLVRFFPRTEKFEPLDPTNAHATLGPRNSPGITGRNDNDGEGTTEVHGAAQRRGDSLRELRSDVRFFGR